MIFFIMYFAIYNNKNFFSFFNVDVLQAFVKKTPRIF